MTQFWSSEDGFPDLPHVWAVARLIRFAGPRFFGDLFLAQRH